MQIQIKVIITVQVRADLDLALDESQHITEDTRIRAAIYSLKDLVGDCPFQ